MRRWPTTLALAALLAAGADAREAQRAAPSWIASWGSAQMLVDSDDAPPAGPVTLRQIVRLSAGGDHVRIRLSNAFGTQPLEIGAGHLAQAAPGKAPIGHGTRLTFSGRAGAVIPAGAEIYSDPVALSVTPGADVAVSVYLPDGAAARTSHPGARATSFTIAGDHVADPDLVGARPGTSWYALADIEVSGGANTGTIVAIGDSITDGHGVTIDRNTRWTDVFAERLRASAATRGIGVVNAGIGGNRVLLDGLGPNLLARFDRDVIARSGVRWAIVLEGVNDLGSLTRTAPATPARHAAIIAQITAGYAQVVARAHAHGIKVIGGTITPLVGNGYYKAGAETEADRQAVNAYIRTSGVFDAVVDFDRILRDPAHPDRLAPAYDLGDHLHPSEFGYRAMGAAVPLSLFTKGTPVIGAVAPVPVVPAANPRPAIAITFDDIPAHGPLTSGQTRTDVIRGITGALAAAKAPAFGFLNAGFGLEKPDDAAHAIAAWRAAGLPLGNHTYAHGNLDRIGTAAFANQVAQNEGPLAAAAKGTDWRWFRYPNLSEGRTPPVRETARAMLKTRRYRIAAVTMSFGDFLWNEPYVACAARRDAAAITWLETSFLADARAAALAARARAKAQLGRDVPYVLLMHVGSFDARMMPRLLDLYRTMGFRFVTLEEAQADPYYAAATDLSRPGPTPSLAGPPSTPALAGPPAGLCA